MDEKKNILRLEGAIQKVIDIQIENNDPPETKEVFDKLRLLKYTPEKCYLIIGKIVAEELRISYQIGTFNIERYKEKLLQIPLSYNE